MNAYKRTFRIDDIIVGVEGYSIDSKGWNGWACPAFTKEEAIKVLDQLGNCMEYELNWTYDPTRDTFIVNGMSQDEVETFTGTKYHTVDGVKTLYAIGAHAWCWEEQS